MIGVEGHDEVGRHYGQKHDYDRKKNLVLWLRHSRYEQVYVFKSSHFDTSAPEESKAKPVASLFIYAQRELGS